MSDLGFARKVGALSASNRVTPGAWLITFNPQDLPANEPAFEVWHGAIRGPGGYFLVYIDDKLFGVGQNGLINEYSPRGSAMRVRRGEAISLHWSIATGAAPTAWLYLRTPEVGRI